MYAVNFDACHEWHIIISSSSVTIPMIIISPEAEKQTADSVREMVQACFGIVFLAAPPCDDVTQSSGKVSFSEVRE